MLRPTILFNAAAKASLFRSTPAFSRFYSAGALSQTDIESRVLEILKGFDKVDQSKVKCGRREEIGSHVAYELS